MKPAYGAGKRTTLRLQANASLGYSCGKFDPFENISQIMNNIKKGIDNLGSTISYGIGSGASALPMYLLYEADPVLAQMITNSRFAAEEAFKLSIKSCEQVEASILNGNGFSDFVSFNMSQGLSKQAKSGATATDAVKEAQIKGTCPEGIIWAGGAHAGGQKNSPIDIEKDVIIAGYNILRDATNIKSTSNTTNKELLSQPIFNAWKNPIEAANWALSVIGQTQIKLCLSSRNMAVTPTTAPGKGLMPYYEKYSREYLDLLERLLKQPEDVENEEYASLGSNLSGVITSIRAMNPIQSESTINRLATEYGLRKTIEMAINAKRLLRIGSKDIDIEAATPTKKYIHSAIDKFNIEISELGKNVQMQQMYVFPTMRHILQNHGSEISKSASSKKPPVPQSYSLKNGAVRSQ